DLDGTLLDHQTYSFAPAQKSLQFLNKNNIPVIFCSSKTRKELLYWKDQLNNTHPFISENGGGIFIPKSYFSFSFEHTDHDESSYIIRFGASFSQLQKTMQELEDQFDVISFLTMPTKTIEKYTGLSKKMAQLASEREYDIPFLINDPTQIDDIIQYIHQHHLHITKGGRFYHLIGENDKGKAVNMLTRLYHQHYSTVESIGIGDSENDFSMLKQVNKPYLVKKTNGSYASSNFSHAQGIGPEGWHEIIEKEYQHNS
ncbi:MAG: HAD-IIB family hydrolase, partial [Thermoplasmatota archaeon]